jgi:proteasome maturation protein
MMAAAPEQRSLRAVAHDVYSQPAAHPVETIQNNWLANQLETKHFLMAQTYGSHLPAQIRMELETVAQSKRLPGMPTCNIAMETILGRDETIDFEDYLGMPSMSETSLDTRHLLEKMHGVLPRSSLHGRIGGPPGSSEPPRADVAMAKGLADL